MRRDGKPSPKPRRRVPDWLRDPWRDRFQGWLERRIPPARQIRLNQKNLFIFISREGGNYLLIAALVWIGATNFQNNLVLALCFLLLAILFVAIHQTFANLSGLTLRWIGAEPVFAGAVAHCLIELNSTTCREQLELAFPGEEATMVSVSGGEPARVALAVTTSRRGWHKPGRCRLQSRYPLGIIRCWTWLDLSPEILVYPRPLATDERELAFDGVDEEHGAAIAGSEDFQALRDYVPGDPLSAVAWKQYAAGRGMLVREQVDYRSTELWLDYRTLPDADPERRLSKLCFHALELAESQRPFGLRLPDIAIEPAAGDGQLRTVLRALAESTV
jgi:uncharacterized protein (DUF58 family)